MPWPRATESKSTLASFFPACFAAVLAAAIYEGIAAARATRAADAGWVSSGLAFFAATAVILAFATPIASGAALVARGGSAWLARSPRLRPSFAWRTAVYVALVGYAATSASIVGRKVIGTMSPHFAATMIVVLALSAGGIALLASRLIIAGLQWLAARAERDRSRRPARAHALQLIDARGGPLALSVVTLVVANALLPSEQFATPAVALIAAGLFSASPWALAASRRGSFVQKSAIALALVSLVCLRGVEKLPARARLSVIYRTPWTSLTLGAARSMVDRDRDGYSPILGGGDCNDGDAHVHPDAVDIPGDGIDQNCSGADAPLPTRDPSEPRIARAVSADINAAIAGGTGSTGSNGSNGALAGSTTTASASAAAVDHPNRVSFILIHMDALRPDHLGFAGYSRKTSPNIDAFRTDATYFSQAYTLAPATRFAMASLFTGRDVDHVPVKRGVALDMNLLPEANTIAEQLGSAGYDRVGYSISYVLQHITGIGQGFRVWETPWPVADGDAYFGKDAPLTTDRAIAYLDGRTPDAQTTTATGSNAKPFMMYTHYQCTHSPYIKHAEWDFGDADVDRYDSALAYCDREVGRLLSAIRRQADHDHIAVVLFSDHGELLGEHGLATHGTSLFQEELHALLLVHLPWTATPQSVDARVTLTDLYPTMLDLAGLPPDPTTRAWNLLPLLDGSSRGEGWVRPLYLYIDQWRGSVHLEERGVLDGPYKYVRDVASGAQFLFDEEHSPREVTNLQNVDRADRDRLAGMLDARASMD